MTAEQPVREGPYAQAAAPLVQAGWWPLPLPPNAKKSPPVGYTGANGDDPDRQQVGHWIINQPEGNVAVRLPKNCVGIDVDAYGDKPGARQLAILESDHGQLPPTTRITSRTDPHSGIRLYRLPAGVDSATFRGGWPGIEVLRFEHRYMVAPPSIHPDTQQAYRAIDEASGVIHMSLPSIDELPELPATWIRAITKEQARPAERFSHPAGNARITATNMCQATENMLAKHLDALSSGAARHDAAVAAALALVRLGDQGHQGTDDALGQIGSAFRAAVAGDRPGGEREAAHEWASAVETAETFVARNATAEADKHCCSTIEHLSSNAVAELVGLIPAPRVESVVDLTSSTEGEAQVETAAAPTTWQPVDLGPFLAGDYEPTKPSIMTMSNGHSLLYPCLVHSIYGESESGKSWVSQIAIAEEINTGHDVAVIDFESDPHSYIKRLQALGINVEQLREHFTYVQPETRPRADDPGWLALLEAPRSLVVIDGLTEALVVFGAKTVDNDEVSAFMRAFPHQLAKRTGAAVVTIDHVSKDKEGRGRFAIGAQAKLATISGAAFVCEPVTPLAPGQTGRIVLRVAKDRPAGVRAQAGAWRASDRTQHAATVIITSHADGRIDWEIQAAEDAEHTDLEARVERAKFRPTILMERVSRFLESTGESSRNVIRKGVEGKAINIDTALSALVDEGYVARFDGARGAVIHKVVAVYREADELAGKTTNDLVPTSSPTSSHLVPEPGERVPATSSLRGGPLRAPQGDEVSPLHKQDRDDVTSSQEHFNRKPKPAEKQRCLDCGERMDPVLTSGGATVHLGCTEPDQNPAVDQDGAGVTDRDNF
ncbi:MAG: bifunctional DNA primase/polymerase [Candidatus Nanopelagicales bacterium]